ncbi:hypothetical protein B0O99DRAFT_256166 [Bisporella sp. PMI_857]|nr:hypothetical protein B0O99DRAFT_256166 [Bisporella sp. PMI_857]
MSTTEGTKQLPSLETKPVVAAMGRLNILNLAAPDLSPRESSSLNGRAAPPPSTPNDISFPLAKNDNRLLAIHADAALTKHASHPPAAEEASPFRPAANAPAFNLATPSLPATEETSLVPAPKRPTCAFPTGKVETEKFPEYDEQLAARMEEAEAKVLYYLGWPF